MKVNPVLKWAGGKTQLLPEINKRLPKQFNTYYEPFLGGGALLFSLLPSSAVINDLNSELMNVYKCIKYDTQFIRLLKELDRHQSLHNKSYYYLIRDIDCSPYYKNWRDYERAARTIYLNKTCFNGLYRVNKKGHFNTPIGTEKYKKLYDLDNITNMHEYLKNNNVKILCGSYSSAVKDAKAEDFVYFDPPYDYQDDDGFTSYTADGFTKENQVELFNLFKELSDKGVYVMLSNNNTDFIRDLYKDYNIDVVYAKRAINHKGDGRGAVEELIITNYSNS
jgi:DNA adenine methylase